MYKQPVLHGNQAPLTCVIFIHQPQPSLYTTSMTFVMTMTSVIGAAVQLACSAMVPYQQPSVIPQILLRGVRVLSDKGSFI